MLVPDAATGRLPGRQPGGDDRAGATMNDTITIRGYVATEVRSTTTESGLPVAGFRICTTERRFDRMLGTWRDGQTNWYTVNLFRQLAVNVGVSVQKGDRVLVTGRLKVRPWTRDDGRSGTAVEVDAESVGHDLQWGTARYRRNPAGRSAEDVGSVAGGLSGGAGLGGGGMTGGAVNGGAATGGEAADAAGGFGTFTDAAGPADDGDTPGLPGTGWSVSPLEDMPGEDGGSAEDMPADPEPADAQAAPY